MDENSPLYTLKGATCIGQTEKAMKIRRSPDEEPVWMPKSQIHVSSQVHAEGDTGTLVCSQWIAQQKGWA